MNAFSWLNDLMTWLGRWMPRLLLIKAGEIALWFGPGGRTRELSPGLYVYWPITTEVSVMSTKLRTLEMNGQVNGREVVAIVASWRIHSAAAILVWNNIPANLDDRAAAYLCRHYHAAIDTGELADVIATGLRAEFGPAGIEIERVSVTQRGPVRTLRLMNEWGTHESSAL